MSETCPAGWSARRRSGQGLRRQRCRSGSCCGGRTSSTPCSSTFAQSSPAATPPLRRQLTKACGAVTAQLFPCTGDDLFEDIDGTLPTSLQAGSQPEDAVASASFDSNSSFDSTLRPPSHAGTCVAAEAAEGAAGGGGGSAAELSSMRTHSASSRGRGGGICAVEKAGSGGGGGAGGGSSAGGGGSAAELSSMRTHSASSRAAKAPDIARASEAERGASGGEGAASGGGPESFWLPWHIDPNTISTLTGDSYFDFDTSETIRLAEYPETGLGLVALNALGVVVKRTCRRALGSSRTCPRHVALGDVVHLSRHIDEDSLVVMMAAGAQARDTSCNRSSDLNQISARSRLDLG